MVFHLLFVVTAKVVKKVELAVLLVVLLVCGL